MNMLGMNRMFNMNSMFGYGNNILGSLFSGTNSIFNNNCFNMFGMNNMFGGGCSLFTNCKGQINYNAIAGFGVANVLLGIGGNILSQYISEKRSSSKESVANDIDGMEDKIDTLVEKLGADNVNEALAWTVDKTDEGKKVAKLNTTLETKNAELAKLPTKEACDADIKAYTDALAQTPAPDANTLAQLKGKKELAEENLEKREALEKEIKKLKDTDIPAAEKKQEAKAKEIKNIQEDIKDYQEKIKNAEKIIDKSIANEADGNKLTRNKNLDVNTIKEGHSNFKKGDIQQLIYQFTQQDDGKGKFEYAQALANLDDTAFFNIATDSQKQVRKWAIEYYEDNKSKYQQPQT